MSDHYTPLDKTINHNSCQNQDQSPYNGLHFPRWPACIYSYIFQSSTLLQLFGLFSGFWMHNWTPATSILIIYHIFLFVRYSLLVTAIFMVTPGYHCFPTTNVDNLQNNLKITNLRSSDILLFFNSFSLCVRIP